MIEDIYIKHFNLKIGGIVNSIKTIITRFVKLKIALKELKLKFENFKIHVCNALFMVYKFVTLKNYIL